MHASPKEETSDSASDPGAVTPSFAPYPQTDFRALLSNLSEVVESYWENVVVPHLAQTLTNVSAATKEELAAARVELETLTQLMEVGASEKRSKSGGESAAALDVGKQIADDIKSMALGLRETSLISAVLNQKISAGKKKSRTHALF